MKIPNLVYEKSLIPNNCRYLLGIDEVGRGPWAGPVNIGAFLLDLNNFDEEFFNNHIRDSKTLSFHQRVKVFEEIKKRNYRFCVISASSTEIDQLGIQPAILKCIQTAIDFFRESFDFVLLDGNLKLNQSIPHSCINKADLNCFSVAAASICAKVTRDQLMADLASTYPGYDFENNKGYGTKSHLSGLTKLGPCPIHRHSYKPIKGFYSSAK